MENSLLQLEETTVDKMLDRLKAVLNLKTDQSLAETFKVSKAVLSSWRKKNSLDYSKLIEIVAANELNINWIIFNIGDKFYYTKDIKLSNLHPESIVQLQSSLSDTIGILDTIYKLKEDVDKLKNK